MAILVRRDGDERAFFSRHWREVHGGVVSGLPFLRSYVQNHVVEEFGGPAFQVDGFVEQLWNSAAEMQQGYAIAQTQVQDMLADEPNYLGHGSNYAMLAQGALRLAEDGAKLIAVIRHRGETSVADAIVSAAQSAPGCQHVGRDDVIAVIAKMGMKVPPVPVDAFLHCYFETPEAARTAGLSLAKQAEHFAGKDNVAIGLFQVRTATIV